MKFFTALILAVLSLGSLQAEPDIDSFFDEEEMFDLEKELAALEAEIAREENPPFVGEILEEESPLLMQTDPQPEIEGLSFESRQPAISQEKNTSFLLSPSADSPPLSQQQTQLIKLPEEITSLPAQEQNESEQSSAPLITYGEEEIITPLRFTISLKQVFEGAPIIYTLLFIMSIGAVVIWLYSLLRMRQAGALSQTLLKHLKQKLHSNQFDEAMTLCQENNNFFCRMVAAGIGTRTYGRQVLVEAMKEEGKRASITFWQKLSLLNDVAIIAPMLGLLGTVLGMFYAFYDLNRSLESFTTLFDGLGISVGTTVAGLIVAILAMILRSVGKYRLVRVLARIENEAGTLATLIDNKHFQG